MTGAGVYVLFPNQRSCYSRAYANVAPPQARGPALRPRPHPPLRRTSLNTGDGSTWLLAMGAPQWEFREVQLDH
jgi:hypothetical protein